MENKLKKGMKTKYYRVAKSPFSHKQDAYIAFDKGSKRGYGINHAGDKTEIFEIKTAIRLGSATEITKEEFNKHYKPKTKKEYITKDDFLKYSEAVKDLTALVKNEFERFEERLSKLENKSKNKGCQEGTFKALGLINKETGEVIKFNEKEKSGWRTWKGTKYLMYHDFEKGIKFGLDAVGNWDERLDLGNGKDYPVASNEEVLQRLTEEAKKRGFNIDCEIKCKKGQKYPAILDEFEYVEEENKLLYSGVEIMRNGVWAEAKPYKESPYLKLDKSKMYYLGDLSEEQFDEFYNEIVKQGCSSGAATKENLKDLTYVSKSNLVGFNILACNKWWIYKRQGHTETNALELFPLKVGDVVKAWDRDKSNFVFGVVKEITNSKSAYLVGSIWYYKVELAPEDVAKYFKK